MLQDLKETLAQELNFENEARNSERCAQELKHLTFVSVPKVFWEQTSKVSLLGVFPVSAAAEPWFVSDPQRVLTAQFCHGCKINNLEEIRRQGLSLKDVSDSSGGTLTLVAPMVLKVFPSARRRTS